MHATTRYCILLLLVSWTILGCSGSDAVLKKVPPTIDDVKSRKAYAKQVAVVLTQAPATAVGKGVGAIYFKSLVEAIADEDRRSRLVTPGTNGYPLFMEMLSRGAIAPDTNTISKEGRKAGLQGVVVAAVRDIRVSTIRTGFMFFRKTRFLAHFHVTADLYDPYSAAKVVSSVMETHVKISEDDYEGFQSGRITSIEDLDEEIADAGEDLGEQIGEALSDLPWMISVTGVEGDRIVLPVGSGAGLSEGDRLAVFEGRRQVNGRQGERFIAPGFQTGILQINRVAEQMAEGQSEDSEKIQAGDIAVPIR